MKYKLKILAVLLGCVIAMPALAQSASLWKFVSSYIQPVVSSWRILAPAGIEISTDKTISFNSGNDPTYSTIEYVQGDDSWNYQTPGDNTFSANAFTFTTAGSNNATFNAGLVSKNHLPFSNNAYDLGSSLVPWRNLWAKGTSTLATSSINALSNLTTNGLVKTSNGDGTLSVDTTAYLSSDDFSNSSTFKIPNGTNPTVNANGKIAQDTTDDQLVYGSTPRVLGYQDDKCVSIEGLAASDDLYTFASFSYPVTITKVWAFYTGLGTTPADITLSDGAGNVMSQNASTTAVILGSTATPSNITSGGALSAYEELAFSVANAVNPESDKYLLCVEYTQDRQ